MSENRMPLTSLYPNKIGRIVEIGGGYGFQRKLRVMGIREGQSIRVVSRQPFRGPLTIKIRGSEMTMGRGMAQKIVVEVI